MLQIGSDHDFRNVMLLRFYASRIASGKRIEYVNRMRLPRAGPDWYLRHNWMAGDDPETDLEPVPGLSYRLARTYEHGLGDGYQWFIYRRLDVDETFQTRHGIR